MIFADAGEHQCRQRVVDHRLVRRPIDKQSEVNPRKRAEPACHDDRSDHHPDSEPKRKEDEELVFLDYFVGMGERLTMITSLLQASHRSSQATVFRAVQMPTGSSQSNDQVPTLSVAIDDHGSYLEGARCQQQPSGNGGGSI
jgi:hypothetical protein